MENIESTNYEESIITVDQEDLFYVTLNPEVMDGQEPWAFLDIILAIIGLIVLSPLFLLISLCLLATGSIFYRQIRVGKNGELFKITKFRSMVENAEDATGAILSFEGDPRVTPFGNFLRKTHLDELPQLLNVVAGDMSLVGPRPERPEFTEKYKQMISHYQLRHSIRPGITGLAQIKLPYDASAQEKLKFDLFYIAHKGGILLNLQIIMSTFFKMMGLKSLQGAVVKNYGMPTVMILLLGLSPFNLAQAEMIQKIIIPKRCATSNLSTVYSESSKNILVATEFENKFGVKEKAPLQVAIHARLVSEKQPRLLDEFVTKNLTCLDESCSRLSFVYEIESKKLKKLKAHGIEQTEFTLSVNGSWGATLTENTHLNLIEKGLEVYSELKESAKVKTEERLLTDEIVDNRFANNEITILRDYWKLDSNNKTNFLYTLLSPAMMLQGNGVSFVFLPNADLDTDRLISSVTSVRDLFQIPDFQNPIKPLNLQRAPYALMWVRPRINKFERFSVEQFEGRQSKYVLLPGEMGQFVNVETTFEIMVRRLGENECGLLSEKEVFKGEKVIKHEELNVLQ